MVDVRIVDIKGWLMEFPLEAYWGNRKYTQGFCD